MATRIGTPSNTPQLRVIQQMKEFFSPGRLDGRNRLDLLDIIVVVAEPYRCLCNQNH